MMKKKLAMLLLLTPFAFSACTWVQLTPAGEKVRLLEPSDVGSCRELGATTASVQATIGGLQRSKEKVQSELIKLASNAAANMGGDTIVPAGPAKDGHQTFTVYKCVNPGAAK